MDGGIPDEMPRRCMIGVAVLPIRRQYQLRSVSPDNARDLLPILNRVHHPAIRQAEVFTKPGAHTQCGVLCLFLALLTRAARSHFTSGKIHDPERSTLCFQLQYGSAGTPFDIIGMRPEEENVYRHPLTAVSVLFITRHLVSILPVGLATTQRSSAIERNCLF